MARQLMGIYWNGHIHQPQNATILHNANGLKTNARAIIHSWAFLF